MKYRVFKEKKNGLPLSRYRFLAVADDSMSCTLPGGAINPVAAEKVRFAENESGARLLALRLRIAFIRQDLNRSEVDRCCIKPVMLELSEKALTIVRARNMSARH